MAKGVYKKITIFMEGKKGSVRKSGGKSFTYAVARSRREQTCVSSTLSVLYIRRLTASQCLRSRQTIRSGLEPSTYKQSSPPTEA